MKKKLEELLTEAQNTNPKTSALDMVIGSLSSALHQWEVHEGNLPRDIKTPPAKKPAAHVVTK